MANERYIDIEFPVRGLDLSMGFAEQRRGTTPVGENVRAIEPSTMRARGGSRSGLSRYIDAKVNGVSLVQDLAAITVVDQTSALDEGGGFQPLWPQTRISLKVLQTPNSIRYSQFVRRSGRRRYRMNIKHGKPLHGFTNNDTLDVGGCGVFWDFGRGVFIITAQEGNNETCANSISDVCNPPA